MSNHVDNHLVVAIIFPALCILAINSPVVERIALSRSLEVPYRVVKGAIKDIKRSLFDIFCN